MFLFVGLSGSVWKLSDKDSRVVKSQRVLDRCSGLRVYLRALVKNLCGLKRSGENKGSIWKHQQQVSEHLDTPAIILGGPMTGLRAPTTSLGAPGSTSNNPGSTSNDFRTDWKTYLL